MPSSPQLHGAATGTQAPAMLREITFVQPIRIEFGVGGGKKLSTFEEGWSARRVLVVTDAFNATRLDMLDLPRDSTVFADTKPEPDVPNLELAVEAARGCAPDVIIGFGGGSVIDIAKLVSVLAGSDKSLGDIAGVEKADKRTVRLITIPTTAGTGSEVGNRALVTDPVTRSKIAVDSRQMLADLAIVDPMLTVSLPPAITAATGVDALAHCVESYTSKRAHPLIDIYAEKGISLVGQYLGRAVADGSDLEARAGLAMASLYGGFCLGPVNTTAGHALAYPLGTLFGVPHGLANAVIFPHTLAFNASVTGDKTARIAAALGFDQGDLFSSAYRYAADLGIEMHMSALGVTAADLPKMAADAHAIRRLLDFNPAPMSVDDIEAIYKAAL